MFNLRKAGLCLSGLTLLALVAIAPVQAQVSFQLGNNPQADEENVLLNNGQVGMHVEGVTNQTGITVNFDSAEVLTAPSNGQARVEAVDGLVGPEPLTISLQTGATFGDIIFTPFNGSGDLMVTANTTEGSAIFTYSLGNGQNFLTIVALGSARITSVVLDPTTGFADLRQIRISGADAGGGGGNVPEPGTVAMLLGMGVSGAAVLVRRRSRK